MIDKQTKAGEYIPPAFPSTFHNGWGEPEKGMALRDYFAAKAMQGMMADGQAFRLVAESTLANTAYEIADAMLKARNENN
jgi:hypothetical protein